MKIGLVGLPGSGKTTLFQLLTGNLAGGSNKGDAVTGVAFVPDERIDWLSGVYKPKKTTYAQIELVDIPGLVPGQQVNGIPVFLQETRKTDALVEVIRVFEEGKLPHVMESINPLRDADILQAELLCADLDLVEKRIQRLKEQKKPAPGTEIEKSLLPRLKEYLEERGGMYNFPVLPEEEALLKNYNFFTGKPMLYVVNMDDKQWRTGQYPGKEELTASVKKSGIPMIDISVQMEREILELPPEERAEFLRDAKIEYSGLYRLARAVYGLLGLISFFTVGDDEVKAWTIKKNTMAKQAAGKIHSDIERGFIRAEVISFDHLKECGSMAKAREKGYYRLEGKEYNVQDGDIINFRFNV